MVNQCTHALAPHRIVLSCTVTVASQCTAEEPGETVSHVDASVTARPRHVGEQSLRGYTGETDDRVQRVHRHWTGPSGHPQVSVVW